MHVLEILRIEGVFSQPVWLFRYVLVSLLYISDVNKLSRSLKKTPFINMAIENGQTPTNHYQTFSR